MGVLLVDVNSARTICYSHVKNVKNIFSNSTNFGGFIFYCYLIFECRDTKKNFHPLLYYASNDSFLLRTGVDCDVSIQILCHALAYKYCGTLYKRHPKKSVAAIQKKPIVE